MVRGFSGVGPRRLVALALTVALTVLLTMGGGPSARASTMMPAESVPDGTTMTSRLNSTYADAADVVIDRFGNATAVWMTPREGGRTTLRAAFRPARGTWSEPTTVGTLADDNNVGYLGVEAVDVVVAPDGTVTAMWSHTLDAVAVASRPLGGDWSEVTSFDGFGEGLVRNAAGVITLVTSTDETGGLEPVPAQLRVHRWRPATGSWAIEKTVTADPSADEIRTVSVAAAGPRTVIAWAEVQSPGHLVRMMWDGDGAPLNDPVALGADSSSTVEVAVEPGGRAAVAWNPGGGVAMRTLRSDGTLSSEFAVPGGMHAVARTAREIAVLDGAGLLVRRAGRWTRRGEASVDHERHDLVALPGGGFFASWFVQYPQYADGYLNTATYAPGAPEWGQRSDGTLRYVERLWSTPAGPQSGMVLWGSPLRSIIVDGDGPESTVHWPGAPLKKGTRVGFRATSTDTFHDVERTQMLVRSARYDARRFGRLEWLAERDSDRVRGVRTMRPGHTYCFTAHAYAGHAWGPRARQQCTTTAINDRAFRATRGWQERRVRSTYRRTLSFARNRGQQLVLDDVRAKRFAILASTSEWSGRVRVFFRGKAIGTASLTSSSLQRRQIIPVAELPTNRTGRLTVRVISRNKPVAIEGVFAGQR